MKYWEVVAMPEESIGLLQAVLTTEARIREEVLSAAPGANDPIFITQSKMAVVPIRGVLLDEWAPRGPSWGATGYNYIRSAVQSAAESPDIGSIVLDINSPGGLVSGMDETAKVIEAAGIAKSGKPVYAIIRSVGASAAYGLACSADRVILSTSGQAGSIGARLVHISFEKSLENDGIKVTQIADPPGKGDISPYQDLSSDARARLQATVNDASMSFAQHVARRRQMTVAQVRALDAQMFPAFTATGQKTALDAKLVDAVAPADDVLAEILRQTSR